MYLMLKLTIEEKKKDYITSFVYRVNEPIYKTSPLVEPYRPMLMTKLGPCDVMKIEETPMLDNVGKTDVGGDHILALTFASY